MESSVAPSELLSRVLSIYSATDRTGADLPLTPCHGGSQCGGVSMDNARATSVGILRASKVRNAEEAIGQSEGLLTVLRLTQADIKPAEDALQVAKRFFDSNQFSKAFHAAKKAESLAITLDERFGGYQKAAKALQSRIDSMRRLGLRTEELETLLGHAEKKVLSGIWDSGAFVPNYLEARVLVERAEQEGRAFQERAEKASNSIFLAELAIESLGEMKGPADPGRFAEGATSELEQSLHEATRQLALGDAEGATKVATEIEEKATILRKLYIDTTKSFDSTEAQMSYLRGEGDRGGAEARAVPPGERTDVPPGHPRSPDARGA